MNIAKEMLRFGAAALALGLMALTGYALVFLSMTGYIPFLAMAAALVFFVAPTSPDLRVLSLAATAAGLIPTLGFAWQILSPGRGPPARTWENGQLIDVERPSFEEVAPMCAALAAGLSIGYFLAFLLWKRVVFTKPGEGAQMFLQAREGMGLRSGAAVVALLLMTFAAFGLLILSGLSFPSPSTIVFFCAGILSLAFLAAPDWRDWRVLLFAAAVGSLPPALTAGWILLQPTGAELAKSMYGGAWENPSLVATACAVIAAALFIAYFAAFVLWKRVAFARA